MKVSILFLVLLLLEIGYSMHLRGSGGFAGPILLRVYQDPKVKEAVTSSGVKGGLSKLRMAIAQKVA